MHKKPTKNRFIAASSRCSTKSLSSLLVLCFGKLLQSRRNYCQTIFNSTGVNSMWIIDNNSKFIDGLRKLSNNNKASSLTVHDFSTLYTNIDLSDLKEKLTLFVTQIFEKSSNYLVVNTATSNVKWNNVIPKYTINKSNYHCITKDILISHLTFLIDNIYVKFGDKLFQQVVGIPMGTNCAPLFANIYLHCYEFDYINKLRIIDNKMARRFSNTYRYIDDLASVNNPLFNDVISDIYPKSLTVNKENISSLSANYLDVSITVSNKKFITKIYDKRDDFKFNVNSLPHASSKINLHSASHVYIGQLLRPAYTCTELIDFHKQNNIIVTKLMKNGFTKKKLIIILKKFLSSHADVLKKWNYQNSQFALYKKYAFNEEFRGDMNV